MNNNFTIDDHKLAMNYQNDYLKMTYTKVVEVKNPDKERHILPNTNENISFTKWIENFQSGDTYIFSKVSKAHISTTS